MARLDARASVEARPTATPAFDGSAFEHAYRAHAGRLRAVAYDVTRDRDLAQDVVHAALLRVWSEGRYRPERGALLPFLIACVRREAYDAVRSGSRRRQRETRAQAGEDRVAADPTAAIDPVEADRVRRALDTLSQSQREVVMSAYYGHRTLSEIANDGDIPLGTVKSRLSQALQRLHAALSEGS